MTVCCLGDVCGSCQISARWRLEGSSGRQDRGRSRGLPGARESRPGLGARAVRLFGGQAILPREAEDAERFLWATPASKSERYVFICTLFGNHIGNGRSNKIYRQASGHLLHPLPLPWSSLNTHRRPLDPRDGRGRSTAPGLEAAAAPSAHSAQIPNSSSLSPANPHHARSHRRSRTLLHPQRPRQPRQPRQPPSRSAHAECLSDP